MRSTVLRLLATAALGLATPALAQGSAAQAAPGSAGAVIDLDRTSISRQLESAFASSGYFAVAAHPASEADLTYTWSQLFGPAPASFSRNGSNGAKIWKRVLPFSSRERVNNGHKSTRRRDWCVGMRSSRKSE